VTSNGRKTESEARKARLAAALRANLKRRKAQAQAKAAPGTPSLKAPGTTPQAGLETTPDAAPASPAAGPKPAAKREQ
jgi:hypothetical protein